VIVSFADKMEPAYPTSAVTLGRALAEMPSTVNARTMESAIATTQSIASAKATMEPAMGLTLTSLTAEATMEPATA